MPVYQLLNLQGFENLEGLNIIKLPTNLKKFFFPQELENPFSNIFTGLRKVRTGIGELHSPENLI
jgi:hypothetical protein